MYGGIVWNRPVEFIPIDGVNQLFGHTPSDNVWKHDMHQRHDEAHDSLNYCIDTYLRFYATFEGDKFGLKDFRKRNQVS